MLSLAGRQRAFNFDHVYDMTATQETVFRECVMQLIESCFQVQRVALPPFLIPRRTPTANAEDPWPTRRYLEARLTLEGLSRRRPPDSIQPLGARRRHAPNKVAKKIDS